MSTAWDVERAEEALVPLAREVIGQELHGGDLEHLALYVADFLTVGAVECEACVEHAGHVCETECDGDCGYAVALEAVRQVLLLQWPPYVEPELRAMIQKAVGSA
jgi:hypothetical protein